MIINGNNNGRVNSVMNSIASMILGRTSLRLSIPSTMLFANSLAVDMVSPVY
tara:strand:- start:1394 stop:1549 length:156 start_codon:yes stop_codon:yes gene_type:complete